MKEKRENRDSIVDRLIKDGIVSQEQCDRARKTAQATGRSLTEVITSEGMVPEETMMNYLAEHYGLPCMKITSYLIDPKIIGIIDEKTARKLKVVPLFKIGDRLTVAMANPLDLVALDMLKTQTKCQIDPVLAVAGDILSAIEEYYGTKESLKELVSDAQSMQKDGELEVVKGDSAMQDQDVEADGAPIVKFVNLTILDAVKTRASDIHIEPGEKKTRVRYRIDGVLHEVSSPPKNLHPAIVSRVKILADINIAERRVPQDGRFQIKLGDRQIDFRVSTFPTVFGEKIVMRLLDKSGGVIKLEQLGLADNALARFRSAVNEPNGIVLVTGPTGSGKSTTLYSALMSLDSSGRNIVTLEDPVEYNIAGIAQGQINTKAGLTFAAGLRSILRQDPNIIMVGEIRDAETAEIAIQAALTGHLVLSTLHTNDSSSAVARLIDMGLEPFLISSSIRAVLAQRLLRKVCPACREEFTVPGEIVEEIGSSLIKAQTRVFRPRGCRECGGSGYRGRTGVYELFVPDEETARLILQRVPSSELKKDAVSKGMRTLRADAAGKLISGITTVQEVLRETPKD